MSASEHQNPERSLLHDQLARAKLAASRMAELTAAQAAAWRRHRAAKAS